MNAFLGRIHMVIIPHNAGKFRINSPVIRSPYIGIIGINDVLTAKNGGTCAVGFGTAADNQTVLFRRFGAGTDSDSVRFRRHR